MLLMQLQPRPTLLPSFFISSYSSSSSSLFPLQRFRNFSAPIRPLTVSRRPRLFCCNYSTVATEEEEEPQLIVVGYISKVHGLKGELRVIPSTDFPHLRFSQPGKRWLRSRVSGIEVISQVELTAGRDHPGQKSWIISLRGIDTVDQAKQIVGSTLMVSEVDRPELEEGEFYTPDLVGMRVVLKETGKLVGVVANVFNHGASDLLQVLPNLTEESLDHSNSSKRDVGASGHVMWVPFVKAIVPEVDLDRREMRITPPKGLLELNLRTDMRSKKERRQLEWKERKKLQSRLAVAKKNLSEMGQSHLLECLKFARKPNKNLLIRQIVGINFKLFQHAMQSIDVPSYRSDLSISANLTMLQKNALKVSSECLNFYASKEKNALDPELHKVGLQLLKQSKVAIIVLMNSEVNVSNHSEIDARISTPETKFLQIQEVLLDYERLLKVEQVIPIPLILVSPTHEIRPYEELLLDRNYFGLDNQKVWFLEEEKLPLIGSASDGKKILMKSSCEILQAPTGSGGVFSLLSSSNIIDKLIEVGVEYVQIISGLQNFDKKNVASVIIAADKGGATHVDIASDPELVKLARKLTSLPICVSSVDPVSFVPAVDAGAQMVEIGNYDSFYEMGRTFSSEQILKLTQETRKLLPSVTLSVTVPHTLSLPDQVKLSELLEQEGADVIQTEGGKCSNPSKAGILGLIEKATPTLAAAYSISRAVKIPVMCSSGLSSVTAPMALTAGAAGVGVGSAVNRLDDLIAMIAEVRNIAESMGLHTASQGPLQDLTTQDADTTCNWRA